jgi:hypothetical protein
MDYFTYMRLIKAQKDAKKRTVGRPRGRNFTIRPVKDVLMCPVCNNVYQAKYRHYCAGPRDLRSESEANKALLRPYEYVQPDAALEARIAVANALLPQGD